MKKEKDKESELLSYVLLYMLFFTEIISQNMQLKFKLNVMSNPGKI